MSPDWTWSDVESEVVPRSDTVDLCLDGSVQRKLEDARRRLRDAKKDDALDASASDIQAEVDALEEQAAAATREFEVVALPHTKWRDLLVEHPSDEPGERYDPATFVPAAIAACCPQFASAEQVAKAAETKLTTGQVSKLFRAVRVLNEGDDKVPFTRGG